MNVAQSANLVGVTGIARRLVLDGAIDEATARSALAAATEARKPISNYLTDNRIVTSAQLAAANSIEFGMPIFDPAQMDVQQSAIKLVKEELLQKHLAVPIFRRGTRLFVGISDPTDTRALDEIKFHTNLGVEPILVDGDTIKRTIEM
ncbi:MAG TPA: type IV-A pilus assembly ATPase PilB, partial [Chloroflexota bacterium]|nr:type IV-A pilus assembly ATPase PilB [Chloroflexota bacterium]